MSSIHSSFCCFSFLFFAFSFCLFQTISIFFKTQIQQLFLNANYATTLLFAEIPRSIGCCFHELPYQKVLLFYPFRDEFTSYLTGKKKNQSSRVYFCSYPFPVKISSYNHVFDFSKLHHIILSFLISSFLPVLKKSVCLLSYIGAFTCALDPSLPYCLTSLTLKSISFTNNIP